MGTAEAAARSEGRAVSNSLPDGVADRMPVRHALRDAVSVADGLPDRCPDGLPTRKSRGVADSLAKGLTSSVAYRVS